LKAETFYTIVESPARLAQLDVDDLREWAQKHPYSQIVQLMYAMRLQYSSEHLFNRQLSKTAIITHERKILFNLFEKPKLEEQSAAITKEAGPAALADDSLEVPSVKEELLPKPNTESAETQQPHSTAKPSAALSVKEKVAAILAKNRALQQKYQSSGGAKELPKEQPDRPAKNKAPKTVKPSAKEPASIKEDSAAADARKEEAPKAGEIKEVNVPQGLNETTKPPKDLGDLEEDALLGEKNKRETVPDSMTPIPQKTEASNVNSADRANEFADIGGALDKELEEIETKAQQADSEKRLMRFLGLPYQTSLKPQKPNEEENTKPKIYTFSTWLKELNKKQGFERDETNSKAIEKEQTRAPKKQETTPNLEDKVELFERFLEKLPHLKKRQPQDVDKVEVNRVVKASAEKDGSLVTETLATVYIQQKHYKKAKQAYEILKLKYPEKSSYFAARISEIENLISS
jgi:hypothetical protein